MINFSFIIGYLSIQICVIKGALNLPGDSCRRMSLALTLLIYYAKVQYSVKKYICCNILLF